MLKRHECRGPFAYFAYFAVKSRPNPCPSVVNSSILMFFAFSFLKSLSCFVKIRVIRVSLFPSVFIRVHPWFSFSALNQFPSR
jgi:hypothetical protein